MIDAKERHCGACPFEAGSLDDYPCSACKDSDEGPLLWEPKAGTDSAEAAPDIGWKDDAGKPRMALVPLTPLLTGIARVMMYGEAKYGAGNLGKLPDQRYRDALLRHVVASIDDPDGLDADSGLPHLWHVAANVAILMSRTAIK